MNFQERIALPFLHRMDPERAHGLAVLALRAGLGPRSGPPTSTRLACKIAGLDLPNPVGLAAGFDKNATALAPLHRCGFGFVEVGAATPRPQAGNPRPRLFRLSEERAAINRFGFNNDGVGTIASRLAANSGGCTGLNLGANKDSNDRAGDFAKVLRAAGPHVQFATINVSSPNTERLRDLQGAAALAALIAGVMEANADLERPLPIFLKIAPDLTLAELDDIVAVCEQGGISAIIATNTTLSRDGLRSRHASEKGGLSGAPLFEPSTRILAQLANRTDLPLIGVGGIGSADEAYAKICAGASAVQIYTALVYSGISLAHDIATGLDNRLKADGHPNVAHAVGTQKETWL